MPISIASYYDPYIYTKEVAHLFSGPQYIGATGMAPSDDDYRALERFDESKLLIRKNGNYKLLDNICAHRQAKIVRGAGHGHRFSCALHRWAYDGDGKVVHTPHYEGDVAHLCLKQTPIQIWNGMIFTQGDDFIADMEAHPLRHHMELDHLVYQSTISDPIDVNWKHYMDGFAENYHVPFVHPGFVSLINLDTLSWTDHPRYHTQILRARSVDELKARKMTPAYKHWVDLMLDYYQGVLPDPIGVLVHYYPNIMLEWYPGFLVMNTVHPNGVGAMTCHIDLFHDAEMLEKRPDLCAAARAAYDETVNEDVDLCVRLAEGRKYLYDQGREDQGPYQGLFEEGLEMFHRYYNAAMKC